MIKISKDLKRRLLQNKPYLLSLVALVGLLGLLVYTQPGIGYEVTVNGQQVGYVKRVSHMENLMKEIDQNLRESKGEDIVYDAEVAYVKGRLAGEELTEDTDLESNVVAQLEIQAPAYLIKSDGQVMMAVKEEAEANEVLDAIKAPFLTDKKDAKAEFVQEVSIVKASKIDIEKIVSKHQAISMVTPSKELALVTRSGILRGTQQASDAEQFSFKPVLDVMVTYNDSADLPVYRAEKRVPDATMTEGQTKVVDEGTNGVKTVIREVVEVNGEVQGKTVLSEEILQSSTPKIIAYGTKPKVSGIVSIAKQYLGVPYRWGGTSPSGFDCSGFTQYVYRKAGVSLPRTSYEQRFVGSKVSRSELRSGDLVLFPGHVGIYVGDGMYIHAPQPGQSVKISSLSSSSKSFLYGRRVN